MRTLGPVTSTGERADAARNRAQILVAASELFARSDPDDVTMEAIAQAAGVGKGTLYRRYPSREAIAVALLDEHERVLQERMVSGGPPLGPGAPPAQRLVAFYDAMLDLLEQHGHLALAAETGARRFTTGAYGFWRAHVRVLVEAAGITDNQAALVDVLLAPLAPELYRHQRQELGLARGSVLAALTYLAERTLRA